MLDSLIEIYQKGKYYYMVLKNPHRTVIEIPYVEYVDINNTNERIRKKYENNNKLQRSTMGLERKTY
jgi:hypothetical protein